MDSRSLPPLSRLPAFFVRWRVMLVSILFTIGIFGQFEIAPPHAVFGTAALSSWALAFCAAAVILLLAMLEFDKPAATFWKDKPKGVTG